ncbi:hypothetical protein HDF18_17205 [Mucilaginibacter sp. X5P1]|uniref:hypothetical protein n=1 Tax=Mucilaginibacter sp. X5P1 TaxID=2723088 RepID=UPI001608F8CB|nr:hypothetical protein [Mucilaginibacter sp. X5P1]MBB6139374.1 signal transduction histidine kinase [Mucilaginibacter sp. X5P1]
MSENIKKTVFKNKGFFQFLVIYISILLLWNIYTGFYNRNLMALLPIGIQVILLTLMFKRDKYAKIAITYWTIIFQIVAFGLIVMGTSIKIINHDSFQGIKIYTFVFDILEIITGIVILIFIQRTVKVEWIPASKLKDVQP